MAQTKISSDTHIPFTHLVILAGGDLLVILSFVWIGRSSHALSLTDVLGGLWVALPFIISWFLVTPWFGLFSGQVCRVWRKVTPRLLIAWAIAGPLGLILRALFLGRPIPGGILLPFALIAIVYTANGHKVTFLWDTDEHRFHRFLFSFLP